MWIAARAMNDVSADALWHGLTTYKDPGAASVCQLPQKAQREKNRGEKWRRGSHFQLASPTANTVRLAETHFVLHP